MGISWDFRGFHGISWDFMGFNGISWDFMGFNGISWDLMGFHGIYGNSMGFDGNLPFWQFNKAMTISHLKRYKSFGNGPLPESNTPKRSKRQKLEKIQS